MKINFTLLNIDNCKQKHGVVRWPFPSDLRFKEFAPMWIQPTVDNGYLARLDPNIINEVMRSLVQMLASIFITKYVLSQGRIRSNPRSRDCPKFCRGLDKPQRHGNHRSYANYYLPPVHIKYFVQMFLSNLGRYQFSSSRLSYGAGTRMVSTVVGDYSGRVYVRGNVLQHNHADDTLSIFKAK